MNPPQLSKVIEPHLTTFFMPIRRLLPFYAFDWQAVNKKWPKPVLRHVPIVVQQ